jgi:hypothetical protein
MGLTYALMVGSAVVAVECIIPIKAPAVEEDIRVGALDMILALDTAAAAALTT